MSGARTRRLSGAGWAQFADEIFDSAPDFVSDWPYGVDSFAVFEYPVFVALAGVERAGVAAAHGDRDVVSLHRFVGEDLRLLGGDVDTDFGHSGYGGRVDAVCWFGAGRADVDSALGRWVKKTAAIWDRAMPANGFLGSGAPQCISTRMPGCRRQAELLPGPDAAQQGVLKRRSVTRTSCLWPAIQRFRAPYGLVSRRCLREGGTPT
jgi:hypothetical protein